MLVWAQYLVVPLNDGKPLSLCLHAPETLAGAGGCCSYHFGSKLVNITNPKVGCCQPAVKCFMQVTLVPISAESMPDQPAGSRWAKASLTLAHAHGISLRSPISPKRILFGRQGFDT